MTGTPRADPWIGLTLEERFEVTEKLAEGGMGAVYRAVDLRSDRAIALKILHAHLARDAEILSRFRREAMAASALGDEHIIDVYSFGELHDGSGVFMAMELLNGRDLGRVLRRDGPLSVGRAARIAQDIASALEHAHAQGIVHRDLKPDNVFLCDDRETPDFVVVLDFGVSKLLAPLAGADEPLETRSGATLGTPHYMAPEQARARKDIDHRVDVFALGVILFRALTGQPPFDADSLPALVIKICLDDAPSLRLWRPDVPPAMEAVVERMMAKNPATRFADMNAVRAALEPFVDMNDAPDLRAAPSTRAEAPAALERDRSPLAHAPTLPSLRPDDDDEADAIEVPHGLPDWVKPVAALAAVLATLLLGWVAWGAVSGEPEPTEPRLPDLPEPTDPQTRAMVSAGSGVGWTWVNPRPRSMPTWYAVDTAAEGERAVLVGWRGAAVRYDGGRLTEWRSGTDRHLRGVAWIGVSEALAVGDGGILVHLAGGSARLLETDVEEDLRAVVSTRATEALAVGDGAVLLRVVGDRVSRLRVDLDADLLAAHRSGESVFVVGTRGTVLRIDDGRDVVREPVGVRAGLTAVGGCPHGELYAAGERGVLLRRRRDGSWSRIRTTGAAAFSAVSCDHGRVVATRTNGELWLLSGARTVRMPSGFDGPWHGASGAHAGPTWLVGAAGRLATLEDNYVRTRTEGPTVPLRDLGALGGALVAVGEWGRVLRQRERGFELVESPLDSGLAALVPLSEGRLLGVGDFGALLDIRYDRLVPLPSPTRTALRDGVVGSDGELLLVGVEGTLVRGPLERLRATVVPEAGDLWAVAGRPESGWVVGTRGTVLRTSSAGFARVSCDRELDLRDVLWTRQGVWAVGADGVIVRLEPDGCAIERRGGPTLHAIGLGPSGAPLAAGDEGAVWRRGADGVWQRELVDVGRASIRTVWRTRRDVYLAGTGGVIVRHVLIDGT